MRTIEEIVQPEPYIKAFAWMKAESLKYESFFDLAVAATSELDMWEDYTEIGGGNHEVPEWMYLLAEQAFLGSRKTVK